MNTDAARLITRLVLLQLAMQFGTYVLTAVFAPRVLLLGDAEATAAWSELAVVSLFAGAFTIGLTLLLLRRVGPALRALAVGSSAIGPDDVLALHAVPYRLVLFNGLFTLSASSLALLPSMRPQALDLYTQLVIVLLLLTMSSTAALPTYVTMRASVAKVLELTPPDVSHQALRTLGRRALGRVRKRFVAAVAAPVAFVALGASLLVDAHVRAYDRDARAADAIDMARAVFEPLAPTESDERVRQCRDSNCLSYDQRGHAEAIEAARALGFRVRIDPAYRDELRVEHGEEGESTVSVPVAPGGVFVRFGTSRLSPVVVVYVTLALAAMLLAALLGNRIGVAFEADVALATREVRRAGVAEVMRGTIMQHETRFANIDALTQTIDALGGVFREFAGAQQRAIDSREANERMRGLLLASMSHDLKAPLNAVLGFAELVGRNRLTDGQRESLSIIEQRGRELLMLIDTILDSARVEAGELEVSPSATQVADIVMSSVLEARDLAVGTEVQIKGEIQPGIPTLFVDGTRIVQAVTAVVMTAVRFSAKGIVLVRATLPDKGDRLRIEVETSGEGLPRTEREKIFDAFRSAESARRHGALGLGLQLARSIAEIHGGGIEVDGTQVGGLIFRVWVPIENDHRSIRDRASKPTLPG